MNTMSVLSPIRLEVASWVLIVAGLALVAVALVRRHA